MAEFSIIIPVYNVAETLPACLDSVYNQTFGDFEVILVDDGSPDGAGGICDEYKSRYPDITTVIHQENSGAGGARNTGLASAAGNYVFFVDGDDTIKPDTLEKVAAQISEKAPDFVMITGQAVDLDGNVLSVDSHNEYENGRLYTLAETPSVVNTATGPTYKIIKREIIEKSGALFPLRVCYEDIRTVPKWVVGCDSFVYLSEPVYNYTLRPGSQMNTSNVMRNAEIIDAMQDLIDWFREKGLYDRYREELDYLIIDHVLVSATVRVLRTESKKHPLIKKFREFTLDNVQSVYDNKYVATMPKNRKTVLNFLMKNMYLPVTVIFRYIKKH